MLLLLTCLSCEEPYHPEIESGQQNILVIEGDLSDYTEIRISHTTALEGNGFLPVAGAFVEVLRRDGGFIASLPQSAPGIYNSYVPLVPGEEYQLQITTPDGRQIYSDWVEAQAAQGIERLYYEISGGELQIYLDSESQGSSGYYRYTYTETWTTEAEYPTNLKWDGQAVVYRKPDEKIFRCYKTEPNRDIVIGSTVDLQDDRIQRQRIKDIDPTSTTRLNIAYSIMVQQQQISEAAFQFWRILKNNTEGLGSIFDAQPSQLPTNYRILNSDDPVIGYLSAALKSEKRIFIRRIDLPFEDYFDPYSHCRLDTVPNQMFPDPLEEIFGTADLVPVVQLRGLRYLATTRYCADCRQRGGTTKKPAYWPF